MLDEPSRQQSCLPCVINLTRWRAIHTQDGRLGVPLTLDAQAQQIVF